MSRFKLRGLLIAAMAFFAFSACDPSPVQLPEATAIQAVPSALSMFVGESTDVFAQVLDQQGRVLSDASVAWSSENPSIASVTPGGVVTGQTAGTTTIVASAGELTDTVSVTVQSAAAISTTPAAVQVEAGGGQTVTAQVTGAAGEPVSAAVTWESLDPTVATVPSTGTTVTIVGASVGSTQVVATSLGATDTIPVTVVADEDLLITFFAIEQDTVRTDVNTANPPVVDFEAREGDGDLQCSPGLAFTSNTAVATATALGNCQIQINPQGPGTTTLIATARAGVEDTVFVEVTSVTVNAQFASVPDDEDVVVGDTVSYTVSVEDEAGNPIEGAQVNFDVADGSLSALTATTDASGQATVEWFLPTTDGGSMIQFTAVTPEGITAGPVSDFPTVLAGAATSFQLFEDGAHDELIDPEEIEAGIGTIEDAFLQAFDRFGNEVDTDPTVSFTNPDIVEVELFDVGTDVEVDVFGNRTGETSVVFTQDGAVDTVEVSVTAGSLAVWTDIFTDDVSVSQITTDFDEVTIFDAGAYTGTFSGTFDTDYPTFTADRDTAAFMLLEDLDVDNDAVADGAWWHAVKLASDGTESTAPAAVIPDSLATQQTWGFPAFHGTNRGTVFFLSNFESGVMGAWNLYKLTPGAPVEQLTTNTSADTIFRGLSISSDGSTILMVNERVDGDVASNVWEVDTETGDMTMVTSNSDATDSGPDYVYAAYSPDDSEIYIDRIGPNDRDVLVFSGGTFSLFHNNIGGEYMPSFNPEDSSVIAYRDANFGDDIHIRDVSDSPDDEQDGLNDIEAFSWSKR